MSQVAFTAQQKPDGKWRLTKAGVDMGVFDSLKDAEEAIRRIIKPVIVNYDERGILIK
jgi:hypothetical protein